MNMSYCRFENTFLALDECAEELSNHDIEELEEKANQYEKRYIKKLIKLCKEIGDWYDDEELEN